VSETVKTVDANGKTISKIYLIPLGYYVEKRKETIKQLNKIVDKVFDGFILSPDENNFVVDYHETYLLLVKQRKVSGIYPSLIDLPTHWDYNYSNLTMVIKT